MHFFIELDLPLFYNTLYIIPRVYLQRSRAVFWSIVIIGCFSLNNCLSDFVIFAQFVERQGDRNAKMGKSDERIFRRCNKKTDPISPAKAICDYKNRSLRFDLYKSSNRQILVTFSFRPTQLALVWSCKFAKIFLKVHLGPSSNARGVQYWRHRVLQNFVTKKFIAGMRALWKAIVQNSWPWFNLLIFAPSGFEPTFFCVHIQKQHKSLRRELVEFDFQIFHLFQCGRINTNSGVDMIHSAWSESISIVLTL